MQQAGNTLALKPIKLFRQQIDKKHPALVKWIAKYAFFTSKTIKIAVLVSWRTTPVSLCKPNDLQLEIQKKTLLS